ncbi:MAG TPA: VOC family protein [Candidatus Eisenbacteria bacterium]|nr:VOC family protein [Candidatus Eisenbacteria bacterium]
MLPPTLDPSAAIGAVHLTVSDLARSIEFYRDRIGLRHASREGSVARFRAGDAARDLLVLTEVPGARRVPGTTGLYHFAILLPTRRDLALALRHLSELGQRFAGYSDHLVSESLYLADPDGNGIEIYGDRPRSEWPRDANGGFRLDNLPLDRDGLLREIEAGPNRAGWRELPSETTIGHMHLQVTDLRPSDAFYTEVLGLHVTARYGSTATFLAAGGYHHHVGTNTWAGVGAPPPPPNAVGLRHFEILLSSTEERDRVVDRIAHAGGETTPGEEGILTRDPSGIAIALVDGGGGGN